MYQRPLRWLTLTFALLCAAACNGEAPELEEDPITCTQLHQCGNECVELRTNPDHCGACDEACAESEFCIEGSCVTGCEGGLLGVCDGACVDQATSLEHCGECGNTCEPGEVCAAGTCGQVCSGETPLRCAGTCIAPATDRLNCGECGRSCAEDEVCSDGQCRADCGGQFPDRCGVTCVDRASDPAHCGTCFEGCSEGTVCVEGECRDSCGPVRPLLCGNLCVDPESDVRFCGNCQTACEPGHRCSGGLCVAGCDEPGLTVCAGRCVDLKTDLNHCGSCGAGCVDGSVCRDGICAQSCGGNFPDECGGVCTDSDTDKSNCGECGQECTRDEVCDVGECRLTCSGQADTVCDEGCVNLDSDPRHCGACGQACDLGESCSDAQCEALCPEESPTLCSGSCVDTLSNSEHCGACGTSCAEGEHCDGATCRTTFEEIVVGAQMACAKTALGATRCWGDNEFASVSPLEALEDQIQVQLAGLPGEPFKLGLGVSHGCALVDNAGTNEVVCWGRNQLGQTNGVADTPAIVTSFATVALSPAPTDLSVGQGHSCALLSDQTVWCWGDDNFNPAGDAVAPSNLGLTNVISITSGGAHNCARTSADDGSRVFCWGSNFQGQLGIPGAPFTGSMPLEVTSVALPTNTVDEDRSLVAGGGSTCAIVNDGDVECWGDNLFGQLGRGDTPPPDDHLPGPVVGLPARTTAIFAGDASFCALLETADLYCWGQHQAAGSSTANYSTPGLVSANARSAGLHTNSGFVISENGSMSSWGSADAGLIYRAPFGRFAPEPCCDL